MTPDLFTKPEPPRRGTRLPADWQPTLEAAKFARSLGLDPVAVADQFRDYWISRAGSGGVKLDWLATWRNWCRTTAERKQKDESWKSRFEKPDTRMPAATEWWPRLAKYKPGSFWLDNLWGPRPETGRCIAPPHELEKWRASL